MLPEHIIYREDRKTLDLLSFALEKSGVPRSSWQAVMSFDELNAPDNCACLYKDEDWWKVCYIERGGWREDGRFLTSRDAIHFLFMILTDDWGPYRFRVEWERESGQEFSMIE